MIPPTENDEAAPTVIDAGSDAVYSLDAVAEVVGVETRVILEYHEEGLVSAVSGPESGDWAFDDEAIRTLRRIEHLREACGANLSGVKLILHLMDEVERLRTELRSRR